jgi:hypothetical protein
LFALLAVVLTKKCNHSQRKKTREKYLLHHDGGFATKEIETRGITKAYLVSTTGVFKRRDIIYSNGIVGCNTSLPPNSSPTSCARKMADRIPRKSLWANIAFCAWY